MSAQSMCLHSKTCWNLYQFLTKTTKLSLVASQKASRGFEPRSLDSESRVLTVTPRGHVWCKSLVACKKQFNFPTSFLAIGCRSPFGCWRFLGWLAVALRLGAWWDLDVLLNLQFPKATQATHMLKRCEFEFYKNEIFCDFSLSPPQGGEKTKSLFSLSPPPRPRPPTPASPPPPSASTLHSHQSYIQLWHLQDAQQCICWALLRPHLHSYWQAWAWHDHSKSTAIITSNLSWN